jgi:hypothetical protein
VDPEPTKNRKSQLPRSQSTVNNGFWARRKSPKAQTKAVKGRPHLLNVAGFNGIIDW